MPPPNQLHQPCRPPGRQALRKAQRVETLGLSAEPQAGENEEEALTRVLLEREVIVPQADEAACLVDFGVATDRALEALADL